jgi:hypothetical protein
MPYYIAIIWSTSIFLEITITIKLSILLFWQSTQSLMCTLPNTVTAYKKLHLYSTSFSAQETSETIGWISLDIFSDHPCSRRS